ncbi:putative transferase, protein kinase RLK-Pelle-RLCK-VIIa-2 family protein, partial [Tanacetum coccineum]
EARSLKEFDYDDLKKATKKFSPYMLLGEGTFGKVYLGWVDQNTFAPSKHDVGVPVAVKRHNQDGVQGLSEWQANGPNAPNTAETLSWGTRLIIMMGVARGLVYLHSSQNQVMCRGVKASDILLDKVLTLNVYGLMLDFTAKLADFGLAKSTVEIIYLYTHVSSSVMGTRGYVDPAYIATGHVWVKSDIYGFGVVLLETLTGLRVIDKTRPAKKRNLVKLARPVLGTRKELKKIIDPRLKKNYPLEGAFKCAALALRCLERRPKDRPSSEEVLQSLEDIYMLLIGNNLRTVQDAPIQDTRQHFNMLKLLYILQICWLWLFCYF